MQKLFDAMVEHAERDGSAAAISDSDKVLTRGELIARVTGLAARLQQCSGVVGLLAPNGVEWAVGELACVAAGKIVVPLPTFFSPSQLGHIIREASIETILTTKGSMSLPSGSGIKTELMDDGIVSGEPLSATPGFGQIIYTSGSSGQPKGVRHVSGQIEWSALALATATGATEADTYLSVLPLSLLLETICAVFIPALVGGYVHFETGLAERVARGDASGIAQAYQVGRPTTTVVVPQLLKQWVGELLAMGAVAPSSLRFVAVGGAPVPGQVAAKAWELGIPVHEGYGLSECCSVVALNRPSERVAGTVGRPLHELEVMIEDGEIIVDGPSITDGYLGQKRAQRPWRTGDLGRIDRDGILSVLGRKDSLIVSSFGRNISPEWIETMLLGDSRIAFCTVLGHGEPYLTALLVPSKPGQSWFAGANREEILALIAACCLEAPDYAVPQAYIVASLEEAVSNQLLTNGRPARKQIEKFVAARTAAGLIGAI